MKDGDTVWGATDSWANVLSFPTRQVWPRHPALGSSLKCLPVHGGAFLMRWYQLGLSVPSVAQNPHRLHSGLCSMSPLSGKPQRVVLRRFTMTIRFAVSLLIQTHWRETFTWICPKHIIMILRFHREFVITDSRYGFSSCRPSPPHSTLSFLWQVCLSENSNCFICENIKLQ